MTIAHDDQTGTGPTPRRRPPGRPGRERRRQPDGDHHEVDHDALRPQCLHEEDHRQ